MNLYNPNAITESPTVALVGVEASQLDEQVKSMVTITENEVTNGKLKRKLMCATYVERKAIQQI